MELSYKKIDELYIIDLPHNIFTLENNQILKNKVSELIEDGAINILLNCSEIIKIDGTGLGVLLSLQKIALYNEVNLRLYGLRPYVSQMLYQTRLNKVFDICPTEDVELYEETAMDNILIA